MKSELKILGAVSFPQWQGLSAYMLPFCKGDTLPKHLKGFQSTVDTMLKDVDTQEVMYLMIDEKCVLKGTYHRRPGVHIDGIWNPSVAMHGPTPGRHVPPSRDRHIPPRHSYGTQEEGLLLASNTGDAAAYLGEYQRDFEKDWRGGCCKEVDVASMMPVYMEPGIAYAGNVHMLHESLPVKADCFRTLVRINVPGWKP